jgi:DNA invertase Pin-like site-specific DNA recombinase
MMKSAAIYARVSSDRQKENHTIASQLAALVDYAETHGFLVPPEWRFQDEGYSGATLLRPGLEALRDLAAAGHIEAALVYSPDRLSRKYAYQVLLAEELSRCGVELVFLKAPSGETPEDQLLVQFQGMIAEYERAQIAERCRRGKRYRAQQGSINVLSGAPYGYRYVKKSDTSAAYYEVLESEAAVVRLVYGEGHGPPADCLPRRLGESGPTALQNAGASQAGPSRSGRIAVAGNGGRRSNQVSAAGRDAGRFPRTAAGAGRHAGRARAAEGHATAGERGPRGPGNNHHPTLDSDTGFRARSEWGAAAASGTSAATDIPARPMLSFAFRPS